MRNIGRDRGGDFGENFVERERQSRFRKYNSHTPCNDFQYPDLPSGRSTPAVGISLVGGGGGGGAFDDRELYYFGVIRLSPEKASAILSLHPPPPDYQMLTPIQRTAYLYYFSLYKKYFTPVDVFHRVFNREYYKYTCEGFSDDVALFKICEHTKHEYKLKVNRRNRLNSSFVFSDGRDTPISRNSERSMLEKESDIHSLDSSLKEPLLHTVPHTTVSFGVGGRVIFLDQESSFSSVRIDDMKKFIKHGATQRHIESLEMFKGPLLVGEIQPQTPLLFIQRQIHRIRQSELYRANPFSSDANDCLLIWNLLEMLVRQQGKVTGPDLARLLIADSAPLNYSSGWTDGGYESSSPKGFECINERFVSSKFAMDKFTQYLLGGLVEEAIESAINDGMLFEALLLAHRVYKRDPKKLAEFETKLLCTRNSQHPVMTLIRVAADQPVSLVVLSADDANAWRAHIAIILANLGTSNTAAAVDTIFQLALSLAQKEFNSAADFCFLAVNLLMGYNCFQAPDQTASGECRNYIRLINASLPDDDVHSTKTKFGWSTLDFQATEIYDYATRLGCANADEVTPLSASLDFQKSRFEYVKILSEYGGFSANVVKYCADIAKCLYNSNILDEPFYNDIREFADRHHYVSNCQLERQMVSVPNYASVTPAPTTTSVPNYASVTPAPTMEGAPNYANIAPTPTMGGAPNYATVASAPTTGSAPTYASVAPASTTGGAPNYASITGGASNYANVAPTTERTFAPTTYEGTGHAGVEVNVANTVSQDGTSPLPHPRQIQNFPVVEAEGGSLPLRPVPKVSDGSMRMFDQNYQHYRQQQSFEEEGENEEDEEEGDQQEDEEEEEPQPPPFIPMIPAAMMNLPPPVPPEPEITANFNSSTAFHDEPFMNGKAEQLVNLPKGNAGAHLFSDGPSGGSGGGTTSKDGSGGGGGGGLLAGLKNRITKFIPANDEMKLPDDDNPSIRYDEKLGRYVGDGVAEEEVVPPPPMIANQPAIPQQQAVPSASSSFIGSGGGRSGRSSRYYNPGFFK